MCRLKHFSRSNLSASPPINTVSFTNAGNTSGLGKDSYLIFLGQHLEILLKPNIHTMLFHILVNKYAALSASQGVGYTLWWINIVLDKTFVLLGGSFPRSLLDLFPHFIPPLLRAASPPTLSYLNGTILLILYALLCSVFLHGTSHYVSYMCIYICLLLFICLTHWSVLIFQGPADLLD